jgi:lipoprotein NlpI
MLENNAEGRYNRDIIESYHYLVAYYITNKDTKSAVDFLRKIFAIDPENERAKGIVRDLKIRL